jgi:hypothetical protein
VGHFSFFLRQFFNLNQRSISISVSMVSSDIQV